VYDIIQHNVISIFIDRCGVSLQTTIPPKIVQSKSFVAMFRRPKRPCCGGDTLKLLRLCSIISKVYSFSSTKISAYMTWYRPYRPIGLHW